MAYESQGGTWREMITKETFVMKCYTNVVTVVANKI